MSSDLGSEAKLRSGLRVVEKLSDVLYTQDRLDAYREPMAKIYRGLAQAAFRAGHTQLGRECLPYWIMLMVGTALMTIFPQIALWLPNKLL